MAFPGSVYAPPGVYTQTLFNNPVQAAVTGVRIPVYIGTGNEILSQEDLQVVRGSSASVDQGVPKEDLDGRAVADILASGQVILGNFDGERRLVQVRNFPIVTGDGSGTTATNAASISVEINGRPDVVLTVRGAEGILELSTAPRPTDEVRVTYFFNRTDTAATDNVSSQVTPGAAVLRGLKGEPSGGYEVLAGNNTLIVTVDGVDVVVDFGTGFKSASTLTSLINGAGAATTLNAVTYGTNFGEVAIALSGAESLVIGDGSANTLLGYTTGASTSRQTVFYTFNGPIVQGDNGGVTTTDPSKVTVLIDGAAVTPLAVNGQTRAVTLPFAPPSGSTVTVSYFFNTYQDTFDYLAHINVTDIQRVGVVPGNSDFIEQADFVLKNDLIVWGTAALIESGVNTQGTALFNEAQITGNLVDVQSYLEVASPVSDQTVNPPKTSTTTFQLQRQPTTGNGRNTPLGQDLFQTVSNGRIDLPTNRPDLVIAYWGWSVQDALERGPVSVLRVEGAEITLGESVPVGATVYATYYYNTLVDEEYTLEVDVPGPAGIGTYFIKDKNGRDIFTPRFGVKGTLLTGITIQFPSGSELTPDVRFESGVTGPVEETVTVTFANKDATLAKYSVPGSGPYFTITDASDHARFTIDSTALTGGGAGIDLSRVDGIEGLGFSAHLLGEEIAYTSASGQTTYDVETGVNDELALTLDGVTITIDVPPGTGVDADRYVTAINEQAKSTLNPPVYTSATRFTGATEITAAEYDKFTFNYTGDVNGSSGPLTVTIPPGTYNSPATLATAIQGVVTVALGTLGAGFAGIAITVGANADGQLTYALDNATADNGTAWTDTITVTGAPVPVPGDTVEITDPLGNVEVFTATATATVIGAGARNFDVSSGLVATISLELTSAINDVTNGIADTLTAVDGGGTVALTAVNVGVISNLISIAFTGSVGAFTLLGAVPGTAEGGGYLEFLDGPTAAEDFSVLSGISTDAAVGGNQTKLLNGDVVRRFSVAGTSGALVYDRILVRNRVVPGSGSMSHFPQVGQSQLKVEGNSAIEQTGLLPNSEGSAGMRATVQPATLLGRVGFSAGQIATGTFGDERDGQPTVQLFEAGGTQPQNNVFKVNIDGTPVEIVFTDSAGAAIPIAGSADVPLGPLGSPDTVLTQINTALTAAGLPGAVRQEGAGIRFTSLVTDTTSAVTIDDGNANSTLGFSAGNTDDRDPVQPEVIASALMSHHSSSVSAEYLTWDSPSSTHFAGLALAGVIRDQANAEFLYIQSQAATVGGLGVSSNILLETPASPNGSWLLPGTNLLALAGAGASGEEGISGFYVTSSDTTRGSGSANTSVLNTGTGQDGAVGQTYRDTNTGLVFTVLEREGGGTYPTGVTSTFTFEVRRKVTTDSNLPVNALPGVELLVTNTSGIGVGDTSIVTTVERGGNEPAIGDLYYVTYDYTKDNFDTALFTRLATIEANYGRVAQENLVTLASYLGIINGAVIVGIKQVVKQVGSNQASVADYRDALIDLRGPLPGGLSLDQITPLRGDNADLYQFLRIENDIQSSIRYRQERTSIVGTSSGTQISGAGDLANALSATRMRVVYPDIVTMTLTDALGNDDEVLVDGTFLASAMAGNRVSPNIDVATPWTNARLVGFNQLARTLDAVEQNQLAVRGVTVLEDRAPAIRVRQGLSTDISNVLTKTPTVITIADEVQRQARITLDRFIGVKFLPTILQQIEGRMTFMFKGLSAAEIITTFTGIRASTTTDPTVVEVEAFYQPVFPLLYIVVTFNLRSTL